MGVWKLCALAHFVGLGLAVGAAVVKLRLVLAVRSDRSLAPIIVRVSKSITQMIVVGMALLTLSGVGWLLQGRPFTPLLVIKIALACGVWVVGPIIDKRIEPKFVRLTPAPNEAVTPAFLRARSRFVTFEVIATGLLVAATALGVLL